MIELKSLAVGYEGRAVLRNISLTFPRGQVTVLLGPNGCGKSTLLKALPGLSERLGGEILVEGKAIECFDSAALAREVSYLPQSHRVPDMTVERLVLHGRFPYLSYPRRYRKEDYAIAAEAMEQVGITEFAHTPLSKLSGGTRQKAYIAMALAQDTGAVLLDEPNAFLDIAHQLQLMELCRDLASRGKAVVLVLHDLNLALEYGDRIALLHEGGLLITGDPETIYQSGALERAFGVEVCRFATPQGWHYACRIPERSLHNVQFSHVC